MNYKIIQGKLDHLNDLVLMALDLWPSHTYDELHDDFIKLLSCPQNAFFLCQLNDHNVGFIYMSIRSDYVEGAQSSPVGFIEGIYVKPASRGQNIAKALVRAGEQWARTKGCSQLGSDIEQHNDASYHFHKRIGFKEANRIICFIKDI